MDYISLIYDKLESEADELGPEFDALHQSNSLYEKISVEIKIVARIYKLPEVDEDTLRSYFETAARQHRTVRPIDVAPSERMARPGYKTWLTPERKTAIAPWNYSEERYFPYLLDKGRSKKVIDKIAESSMYVLENMGDPKANSFFKKGLVVGEVQSGKTAHFNAVVNRSIDAGYRLIIILSGIMDDLRRQTQKRIEEDVIGYGVVDEATDREDKKGVGVKLKFGIGDDGGYGVEQIRKITTHKNDYRGTLASAGFQLDDLNILVCKKNVGILKNLLKTFHDRLNKDKGVLDVPLLIVDDEADNASLNNMGAKGKQYASKVNLYLRALLGLFERKTYLGYTATPFANVLQDQNEAPDEKLVIVTKNTDGSASEKKFTLVPNLFPEDFIELIKSPSNYIGAKHLFEATTLLDSKKGKEIPLIEYINDHVEEFPASVVDIGNGELLGIENHRLKQSEFYSDKLSEIFESYSDFKEGKPRASKRYDDFPRRLPKSLKDAIGCFILSIAIRDSRKPRIINSPLYNRHNTMLVHVSRFITWQNKTKELIEKEISELARKIDNDEPQADGSIYKYLEQIWYDYYATIVEEIGEYLTRDHKDEFMTPLSFKSVMDHLPKAIEGVEVKALNSYADDQLKYERPQKVIVVGGNRLSRGFTLEGLTVNYFCRSTSYSDSLLQMGRWFGYRPGYLDCCKIFTTSKLKKSFDLTTQTFEGLEHEFERMKNTPGKSPANFILRVQNHPGALQVTRKSILRNTVREKGSFQNHLVQTVKFDVTKEAIQSAWKHFQENIISQLDFSHSKEKGFFISEQISNRTIRELIKGIESFITPSYREGLVDYIKLCEQHQKLQKWTVAIKATGRGNTIPAEKLPVPHEVQTVERNGPPGPPNENTNWHAFIDDQTFYPAKSNIVTTGRDLSLTIPTEGEIEEAEGRFVANKEVELRARHRDWSAEKIAIEARKIKIPEWVYRECIPDTEGVLIIYLIDIVSVFRLEDEKDKSLANLAKELGITKSSPPLVGYAVGIPPIEPDPGGEYLKGNYDIQEEPENEDEEAELNDDELGLPNDYTDDEL